MNWFLLFVLLATAKKSEQEDPKSVDINGGFSFLVYISPPAIDFLF